MTNNEVTIWGIHAGKSGDADTIFLKKKFAAIGWSKLGNLKDLQADREAFKVRVADIYPDAKAGAIANNAGQLWRFVYEMKPGDIVVYPSKRERKIHIGEVAGPYVYDPDLEEYPNLRPVKWLRTLPRTHFSQGALHEIGSWLSLFQIKTYTDEFRATLEGRQVAQTAVKDETVAMVADDVEKTTCDFILKQLAQELPGHPLAQFIAHLLEKMGYHTRISPEEPDDGVDIVAHRDELGFKPPILKVQVKSSESSVGDQAASALYSKVGPSEFGLLVTLGTFTKQARDFARGKNNLRLIDASELAELVLQHYEQFDPRYKGLLPLKRVYVPEVLEKLE